VGVSGPFGIDRLLSVPWRNSLKSQRSPIVVYLHLSLQSEWFAVAGRTDRGVARGAACQPMGRAGSPRAGARRLAGGAGGHLQRTWNSPIGLTIVENPRSKSMQLFCCAPGLAKSANLLRCESDHGVCAPLSCSSPVCRSRPRSRGWPFQVTARDRRA
jgi:hypothetical protein